MIEVRITAAKSPGPGSSMTIWVDAQLPQGIASWLSEQFSIEAIAVRDLGLRDAEDEAIFAVARTANAVVMTKDRDFVDLVDRLGSPPQVLWITCGNTSNARLRELLLSVMPDSIRLLDDGEPLVEISDGKNAGDE